MLLLELFSGKECIELFVFGVFGATNTSTTIATIACQGAWVLFCFLFIAALATLYLPFQLEILI